MGSDFKETAHLKVDIKKFEKGYDRIFIKKATPEQLKRQFIRYELPVLLAGLMVIFILVIFISYVICGGTYAN